MRGESERESIQLSVYQVSTFSGPVLQHVESVRLRHSQGWQLVLHTGDLVHDSHWVNDENWMYGVWCHWCQIWVKTGQPTKKSDNPLSMHKHAVFGLWLYYSQCADPFLCEHQCTHATEAKVCRSFSCTPLLLLLLWTLAWCNSWPSWANWCQAKLLQFEDISNTEVDLYHGLMSEAVKKDDGARCMRTSV